MSSSRKTPRLFPVREALRGLRCGLSGNPALPSGDAAERRKGETAGTATLRRADWENLLDLKPQSLLGAWPLAVSFSSWTVESKTGNVSSRRHIDVLHLHRFHPLEQRPFGVARSLHEFSSFNRRLSALVFCSTSSVSPPPLAGRSVSRDGGAARARREGSQLARAASRPGGQLHAGHRRATWSAR